MYVQVVMCVCASGCHAVNTGQKRYVRVDVPMCMCVCTCVYVHVWLCNWAIIGQNSHIGWLRLVGS